MIDFDLDAFIAKHVIGRDESLFAADLAAHEPALRAGIHGKSVLVMTRRR